MTLVSRSKSVRRSARSSARPGSKGSRSAGPAARSPSTRSPKGLAKSIEAPAAAPPRAARSAGDSLTAAFVPPSAAEPPMIDVELFGLLLERNGVRMLDKVAIPNVTETTLDELHEEADLFNRGRHYDRAAVVCLRVRIPWPNEQPRPLPVFDLGTIGQTAGVVRPNYRELELTARDRWTNGAERSKAG